MSPVYAAYQVGTTFVNLSLKSASLPHIKGIGLFCSEGSQDQQVLSGNTFAALVHDWIRQISTGSKKV
jgi:hypothetical protein